MTKRSRMTTLGPLGKSGFHHGGGGGGGLAPISLPYLVDWHDGDGSEIQNSTGLFREGSPAGGFRDVSIVGNPQSSQLAAYSNVALLHASSPEQTHCSGYIDLGGTVDLSNGLRIQAWINPSVVSSSHYNVYPFMLDNGKAGEEASYIFQAMNYGQESGRWVISRVRKDNVEVVATNQADKYPTNGANWVCVRLYWNFETGKFKYNAWYNTGSNQVNAAEQSFTPFEPPTDFRYLRLWNPGSTSEWNPVIYTEKVHVGAIWFGSLNDDYPANVSGSARWSL